MLDAIRSFFDAKMASPPEDVAPADDTPGHEPIHIAACALLLEVAYADQEFTAEERQSLEMTIERHFDLAAGTAQELVALADAERRQAVDLFQFTSLISEHYDDAQKMVLLEAMWGIVYADGLVDKHEAYLMRKVSALLDVRPGFLAQARKRVEGKPSP